MRLMALANSNKARLTIVTTIWDAVVGITIVEEGDATDSENRLHFVDAGTACIS